MALSFLGIGVLWPPCINLLVHGSLRRPAEEKGADLSKVNAHAGVAAMAPTALGPGHLHELEAELEHTLQAEPPSIGQLPPPPAPIRQLGTETLASPPVAAATEEPEFGRKKDDYYPTALRHGDDPPDAA